MEWLKENWVQIGAIAAALVVVFDMIAKATTTKKDDKIADIIKTIIPILWPKGGKKDDK